jgi:hypothetical protein
VIAKYWDPNKNFRTRFLRIIKRAELIPWTKPFHNLRATRETELAAEHPLHVVCAWMGNTATIARKHYLQVPRITSNGQFEAAQKAAQWRRKKRRRHHPPAFATMSKILRKVN